jgi:tetratricopeptide (TPR) repeat protein
VTALSAGVVGLAGLLALALWNPAFDPAIDSAAALAEGNRLFRQGDLDAAYRVYASGLDPADPDPLLAYNLATTAHHLDRLPEAVLWYRRAAAVLPPDAWLAENLALARRALGTDAPAAARPLLAVLGEHRHRLSVAGVVLAWAVLPLLIAGSRQGSRRRFRAWMAAAAAVAVLAATCFAAGQLPGRLGPRAAVLLAPCNGLPAGSEVWVRAVGGSGDGDGGGWRVTGAPAQIDQIDQIDQSGRSGPACPSEAVGLVAL